MTFNEFIKRMKKTGGVDVDGYYGKQCMDLYNYYCKNVLGISNTGAPTARGILKAKEIKYFKVIKNTPDFVPKRGDIAVWTGGMWGHVAVCLGKGNKTYFETIEQNWVPQKLTFEKHNYNYMGPIYFLRYNTPSKPSKPKVNIDDLARRVIKGEFGTGIKRRLKLGRYYNAVQKRVNEMLAKPKAKKTVNIKKLADDVLKGKYGNGAERKRKLGKNYNAVQKEINKRYGIY